MRGQIGIPLTMGEAHEDIYISAQSKKFVNNIAKKHTIKSRHQT